MALRVRQRIPPTDEWQQLTLLLDTDSQHSYEVIRPVVVFGEPVPARASATRVPARTIYRTVARFEAAGLAGLEPPAKLERRLRVSADLRQHVGDGAAGPKRPSHPRHNRSTWAFYNGANHRAREATP